MDPSQENVRKRLLLLILANSKKKWRKKRKFVREKEKEKEKNQFIQKKTPYQFWLIVYYWDQFDTISKKDRIS